MVSDLHPLHWAEVTPDRTAWIFGDERVTYERLAEYALKGAQHLRKLGLNKGDGVAVVAENHPN
ncbi:MAG: AMP-binding protein, partial [Pseudomonadales bacterium]|nr:long-chain fatty acid--CoA ligase [Pseudomonadales bacterium]NIX08776.1 AMP-binding protein [Pseudomonadales bacterium]